MIMHSEKKMNRQTALFMPFMLYILHLFFVGKFGYQYYSIFFLTRQNLYDCALAVNIMTAGLARKKDYRRIKAGGRIKLL
jgi:hypothetical protein